MIKKIKKIFRKRKLSNEEIFLSNGKIPWSTGYHEFKWKYIDKAINDADVLNTFSSKLPSKFGHRIDERIVEYPWIFSNLSNENEHILDAGSTFNFNEIVNHEIIKNKELTIFTFAKEANQFNRNNVKYVYGDLRKMPFEDKTFDTIVSQSTIEHIDMDNSIYGYDIDHNKDSNVKSYEYIDAVNEMVRVLKNKGIFLLTFPYGKFENHGFFQQFDEEMLDKILTIFSSKGSYQCVYYNYLENGWSLSEKNDLKEVVSYNPHTGKGKGEDNAAHCRSVVCIKFTKSI